MGGGANLYSLEAISEALMGAGSIAAASSDEQQIIRGYLAPLAKVLHASCVAFFPSASSPISASPVIHSQEPERFQLPSQLLASMELAIRNAAHQTVTSEEAAFLHGHLKHIPGACMTSASMWSCVPAGETDFGTIAIFDVATRSFDRVEQQLLRTFALQLSYALKSLMGRKQAAEAANPNSREVYRYIESTKFVGNVARDLTNPLTAIFGFIELLRAEELNDRGKAYLRKLQTQAEKMQDIVMAMHSAPKPPREHAEDLEQEYKKIPHDISLVPMPPGVSGSAREVLIQSKPPVVMEEPAKPQRSATGRSCVLVIQKSDAVVEFEKSVLAALNAEVRTANTGSEAVSQLQSKDVHAVLLGDELEGEWRSKALLEWIEEHRPDLKERVLLTVSAQPKSEIVELIERRRVPFVTKPLQIMDLFAGMRQILGFSPEQLDKKFLN
jgi:CheY-like chemotaxis protein